MARQLKPCGTASAYIRHYRRGEPIDDACREAHYAANQASKVRRGHVWQTEVDEAAVALAVDGKRPRWLTLAERQQVVRILHGRSMQDDQIGERVGLAASSVYDMRRRLNLPTHPAVTS